MKVILADPTIKKAMVPISSTSRQNPLVRQMCERCLYRAQYIRSTLSIGDVSIKVYVHESLTAEQAFNRPVEHYKAWCVNQPGGRR